MVYKSRITPKTAPDSESHIIGEVLDIGALRELYVKSSTSAKEYR